MMAGVPQATLNWLYDVLKREYHDPNRTYSDLAQTLGQYPGLTPRTDVYTSDNGIPALLLHLKGTLPVNFRGAVYQFPIALWIPHAYPREAPIAYVTPTDNMVVRPGQHVSASDGKIYHHYLAQWTEASDRSAVVEFLKILAGVFSREPPVMAKSQQMPQQSQIRPGGPPPVPAHPGRSSSPGMGGPPPPPPKHTADNTRPGSGISNPANRQNRYDAPPPLPQPGQGPRPPPPPPQQPTYGNGNIQQQGPPTQYMPQRTSSLRQEYQPRAQPPPPLQSQYRPQSPARPLQNQPQSPIHPQSYAQYGARPQQQPPQNYQHPAPPREIPGQPPPHPQAQPLPPYAQSQAQPPPQLQQAPPQPYNRPTQPQHLQQRPQSSYPPAASQPLQQSFAQGPPQGQPQGPPRQPPAQQPPQPQAPKDLLSEDDPFQISLTSQQATLKNSNIPAPPIPTNPQKTALLAHISHLVLSHLQTLVSQTQSTALPSLHSQHVALTSASQTLGSELTQLSQLSTQLQSNINALQSTLNNANTVISHTQDPKHPSHADNIPAIDQVIIPPTVVARQLYDAVAEQRGYENAIMALNEAFVRGRMGSEIWGRKMRECAREEMRRKWLVRKIGEGLGLEEV